MSTLSIHPIEYLRLHLHYKEVRTGLLASLRSLVKKVFESSDQAATIAVVLLTFGLVIFGLMKIGESVSVAANYNAAITEMVLPPLQQAIPTGM
jgi:spore maturation protein SpmA